MSDQRERNPWYDDLYVLRQAPWRIFKFSLGRTNRSPAITLTYIEISENIAFNPVYLPNPGFVFNYVTRSSFPPRLYPSGDLKTWSTIPALVRHAIILVGTNLHHSFFYVKADLRSRFSANCVIC